LLLLLQEVALRGWSCHALLLLLRSPVSHCCWYQHPWLWKRPDSLCLLPLLMDPSLQVLLLTMQLSAHHHQLRLTLSRSQPAAPGSVHLTQHVQYLMLLVHPR
jgi:hypothetical protein